MTALVAAHHAFPGQRTLLAALVNLGGAAAIGAGVAWHRPARWWPWLLIAAANLTGTLGVLAGQLQVSVTHRPLPFPSLADAVYLLGYPLFVAGLALFIRSRTAARDQRSVFDAVIALAGLALLSWLFLVVPSATDASFSWAGRLIAAAYPVGDLLVLVTLGRLLTPGAWRGVSLALLTLGTVASVASDVAYDVAQSAGRTAAPRWCPSAGCAAALPTARPRCTRRWCG